MFKKMLKVYREVLKSAIRSEWGAGKDNTMKLRICLYLLNKSWSLG